MHSHMHGQHPPSGSRMEPDIERRRKEGKINSLFALSLLELSSVAYRSNANVSEFCFSEATGCTHDGGMYVPRFHAPSASMNVPSSPVSCHCTPPRFRSTLRAVLLPFAAAGPESAVEHGVRERTPLYWMNGPSTLSQHSESAS